MSDDWIRERLEGNDDALNTNDKRLMKNLQYLMQEDWGVELALQIMEYCQAYADVWDRDYGQMCKNTGRQDIGRWLRRNIMSAAPRPLMEAELAALNKEVNHDRSR